MLILGIDPGVATTGYGLVKVKKDSLLAVDWGLIETNKELDQSRRLYNIYKQMRGLLREYDPDIVAIEKIFFATNAKTAIAVGQAQGVMLLSTSSFKADVFEYAPGTIKKMVAGDGRADKKKMQRHLRKVFGAKVRSQKHKKTHFDNAADALAVALCHVYKQNGKGPGGGEMNGKP